MGRRASSGTDILLSFSASALSVQQKRVMILILAIDPGHNLDISMEVLGKN